MRNSNTSPDLAKRRARSAKWLVVLLAAVCLAGRAQALDPSRALSQYLHDRWDASHGFPGGTVYSIAQTADGYLWIGTEKGLIRFDGWNFRLFDHANVDPLPPGPVLGVATDARGTLWIRPRGPGLVRYHDGTFLDVTPKLGHADTSSTAIGRATNGDILLAYPNGTITYGAGGILKLGNFFPLVISITGTADARIWMGTKDAGLFWLSPGRAPAKLPGLPDTKVNSLLPVRDGELWIGTDRGLVRWDGTKITQAGVPSVLEHAQVLVMTRDTDSNIWVGTDEALVRVNSSGVAAVEKRDQTLDGSVTALFEDREGDLWVGTTQGLERSRQKVFMAYPTSGNPAAGNDGPIFVDSDGRAWYGPSDGGLYWVKDTQSGRVTSARLDKDVVYSIDGGETELWLGRQHGGLTRLRSKGGVLLAQTYTQADGLVQDSVYAVHRSRDGTVWAGTLNGGLSRLSNGRFMTYTRKDGLLSDTVNAIEESSDGTMWFATPNGLAAYSQNTWRAYTGRDGLPPGGVNCLAAGSQGVLWIGTDEGLAYFASGHIRVPLNVPESLREPVFGVSEDQYGWLWIATADHVFRTNRAKALDDKLSDADVREYSVEDGLTSTRGVRRHRSLVEDRNGRIWFSLNHGLSYVDPARLTGDSAPALVQMQTITADGMTIESRDPVRIPPKPQRITLQYIGLNFSAPDRVNYRYLLEGFDRTWSHESPAREAVYTNLSPGFYRFRMLASNPDGLWNGPEADVAIEIEPALSQTWWFQVSIGLACAFAIAIFWRLRLQQLTRQLNLRFEERLGERARIAQELHDTLLQGFLSASMQVDVAAGSLPEDSPAKASLSRILLLMRSVIDDGRKAVGGLRSSQSTQELEEAFSGIRQELGVDQRIEFRVMVDGKPQPLHPVIRDEVYRIGREALTNAFRHSQAQAVEIEIEYSARQLRILVRDNGCGIDPNVVRSGREGHWGLPGMRERAERIGARFHVWSSATAGTEIELSIPGHIAFERHNGDRPRRWLSRFASMRTRAKAAQQK